MPLTVNESQLKMNATTAAAHFIFPAAALTEQSAAMVSFQRHYRRFPPCKIVNSADTAERIA